MSDILEITRKAPENKSMDYEFLRQEGIKYIQELSSKIWTDYNVHDPGITMLEALCYAITDLGNRASYPIRDIIAIDGANYANEDKIKNFYKAEQILPNAPLTINDYRKLLMDIQIEVEIPGTENKELVGIKNAWIKKSAKAEQRFYLHKSESLLSFDKDLSYSSKTGQTPLYAGHLYNVLLEFSHSNYYDDLNHNTIDGYLTVYDNPKDTNLEGLIIGIDLTLPRWDREDIDWENLNDIKANIGKINIDFLNLPNNYELAVNIGEGYNIALEGTLTSSGSVDKLTNLGSIEDKINSFLCDESNEECLVRVYQQKIYIIKQILNEVEKTLNDNRNLCDGFLKPGALKVEEIGICADLQVDPDSNIEELLSQVYYLIGKFLSPTVNFYTLSEMLDLCISEESYVITNIDKDDGYFTVSKDLTESLFKGDTITIKNSISNDADYTVVSVGLNSLNEGYSDVYVEEDIASGTLTENDALNFKVKDEDKCLTVDKIFDGPLLKHGFIDNGELENAELMKVIHVSDLIQIIMDIPGIIAVKNLEIASYPEEPEYDTELKSVKWVLELSYKQNYVPRLSIDKSTVVFYKDQLPYKANKKEVEELVNGLISAERPQKLSPPVIYPQVPDGTYRNLAEYTSIQEDFPLHYGVGYEGIPNLSNLSGDDQKRKIGQTRQLKAYLMFFDQLLANYLAQLENVKYLFSMNAEKDESGGYKIGRTYYTQTLFSSVSDPDPLYINKEGHEAELELIAENESLFNARRNKFLDHLLARFAESFTDYALLITRLSGNKAPGELIDDKLNFLNRYPEISSGRGLAFNYLNSCKFWHIDNKSGLEKRSALLMGIREQQAGELVFSNSFKISPSGGLYNISIEKGGNPLLIGTEGYTSVDEAKEMLESILILAIQEDKYEIVSEDSTNYFFNLVCGKEIIATSYKTGYSSAENALADAGALIEICMDEFFENHGSNRNNLTPPIDNYFKVTYATDEDDADYYKVVINLYSVPFEFEEGNKILGLTYQIKKSDTGGEEDIQKNAREYIWKTITYGTMSEYYIFDFQDTGGSGDPEYVFRITDRDAVALATSIETDFNQKLVAYIEGQNQPLVRVNGSTANNGYYSIDAAGHDGPNVILNIPATEPIPSTTTDGNLSLTGSYDCDVNAPEGYLIINQDITGNLNPNDIIGIIYEGLDSGHYTIEDVHLEDSQTYVGMKEPLPEGASQTIVIYPSYAYSLDELNKTFTIDEDITGNYIAGDVLTMWEKNNILQVFTIKVLDRYGDKTRIVVKESINEDPRGRISFTKIYPQVRIDNPATSTDGKNAFTIKGGEGNKAVREMVNFLKTKFTEKEGVHLIEHVLLRPKNNNKILVLSGGLTDFGSIVFKVTNPLILNNQASEIVGIQGDIVSEIYKDPKTGNLIIDVGGFTFELYSESVEYNAPEDTTVFDLSGIYPEELASPEGTIYLAYQSSVNILSIDEKKQKIQPVATSHIFSAGETILVTGSEGGTNDGTYTIEQMDENGFIIQIETLQDKLLPIFLSDDCTSYNLSNPYTSIATVVLPYWPERFNNMDFRNFFENTIRMEAPAHVLLKICWVNPVHMEGFEKEFKKWLLANNRPTSAKQEVSEALSQFIDAVDRLRNVYPMGTLYDPEEHETLKNTIILNNTMLGSF